jgi:hypothetical protein
MEHNSSVANASTMPTARANAALFLPAFALVLVLQPRMERKVAVSVEGPQPSVSLVRGTLWSIFRYLRMAGFGVVRVTGHFTWTFYE